jgi:hypothetical protein
MTVSSSNASEQLRDRRRELERDPAFKSLVKQSGRGDVRASVEVLKLRGLYGDDALEALDSVVIPRTEEALRRLTMGELQLVALRLRRDKLARGDFLSEMADEAAAAE